MPSRRATFVVLLLAATLLAGCADGKGEAVAADGAPQLAATATTGVLRGIVVDDAIRPVANASITARGPDGASRQASSDADGFFGFANLQPGTWFVSSSKLAYTDAQTSVEVVAGVDDPPLAKLQVLFVPGEAPFYVEVKHEAFVQCIVPGANLCAIVNLYPCALAGLCDPLVDDSSYIQVHESLVSLQRHPDWYQTEVVWQSTQAVTPDLAILASAHSPDDGAGRDARQAAVHGASPLLLTWDNATAVEWEMGTAEGVAYEVFGHTETLSLIGSVGFVISQQLTAFVHAFYGYAPPADWRFSSGEGIPSPPR